MNDDDDEDHGDDEDHLLFVSVEDNGDENPVVLARATRTRQEVHFRAEAKYFL